MPFVESNGIRIHYEQQGVGPDVLFIGGLSADLRCWEPQRAALAAHFRLTMFDNRGVGRSDAPDEPYSTRLMAEDAAGLLDALRIERAHIIGTSMGGMIAQELAIAHPEKIDRLVLACSRMKAGPARVAMGPVSRWLAEHEKELPRAQRALLTLPWMWSPAFVRDEEKVVAMMAGIAADPIPIPLHGYLRQNEATIAHDTTGRLGAIRAPTLVLVGAEDILTPPSASQVLADNIPGAVLRVLPRGAHTFFLEYAEDVNAALLEFLLGQSRTASFG